MAEKYLNQNLNIFQRKPKKSNEFVESSQSDCILKSTLYDRLGDKRQFIGRFGPFLILNTTQIQCPNLVLIFTPFKPYLAFNRQTYEHSQIGDEF